VTGSDEYALVSLCGRYM